ncbi:nicotinate-nucleotide--dimethylbenzimidazole phosphoribosyltransferase [uncultured Sphingomonas sp.]|uniref:nicotinate-nucleotide--dimethylbenzimidazole phosphoribosyltransferase n=1 Tax=uncultured Sphingomonas sp. TaxID=158754 RepID=UPI0035CA7144
MPLSDAQIARALDAKTKPPGSLGRLETLAARIARFKDSLTPTIETATLLLFAADHGIAAGGVSAYPQTVTRQMLVNFLDGGAAATVIARSVGVEVRIVDAGVAGEAIAHPALISRRIAAGTRNSAIEPAMGQAECDAALAIGRELAEAAPGDAICLGEMGIGNSSAAALVGAKLLGRTVGDLVGPGTGVDAAGLDRKRAVLAGAASRTDPLLPSGAALREYGGFEIVMMAGAAIGAAATGRIVIVDGFIATAAALAASKLEPASRDAVVFAHRSAEPGHRLLLDHLGAEPLLDLGMRLGEGTGALLAWPLVKAAAAMLREMATFEDAGVSGRN